MPPQPSPAGPHSMPCSSHVRGRHVPLLPCPPSGLGPPPRIGGGGEPASSSRTPGPNVDAPSDPQATTSATADRVMPNARRERDAEKPMLASEPTSSSESTSLSRNRREGDTFRGYQPAFGARRPCSRRVWADAGRLRAPVAEGGLRDAQPSGKTGRTTRAAWYGAGPE